MMQEQPAPPSRRTRRPPLIAVLLVSIAAITAMAPGAAAEPADRVPPRWAALRAGEFAVASAAEAQVLAPEAIELLGSTDGLLRDEIAYSALTRWIYRDRYFDAHSIRPLLEALIAQARLGRGDPPGDSTFRRSFSILTLATLAAADNEHPLLQQDDLHRLVEVGVLALRQEKDLRGYVSDRGWGHAIAHSADLLKFLGRSPRVSATERSQILDAVRAHLTTRGEPMIWGEEARLAATLESLARRSDFDSAPFLTWLSDLRRESTSLWSGDFRPDAFIRIDGQRRTLAYLDAALADEHCTASCAALRRGIHDTLAATS